MREMIKLRARLVVALIGCLGVGPMAGFGGLQRATAAASIDFAERVAPLLPEVGPKPAKGEDHWAFQPLVRPAVPRASPGTSPIDAFLAQRLAATGLAMNPEADPRTLIRRVSFDLIGLPPSPEAIDAFERSRREAGGTDRHYRELVERLLAAPQHGERWAREFGRMPTFQKGANGRDHNPAGFTVWLAGAGVKRAFHHGATDEFGYKAVENVATIYDLHATILRLLGLDHTRLSFYNNGIERRLTDVHGHVIEEILA